MVYPISPTWCMYNRLPSDQRTKYRQKYKVKSEKYRVYKYRIHDVSSTRNVMVFPRTYFDDNKLSFAYLPYHGCFFSVTLFHDCTIKATDHVFHCSLWASSLHTLLSPLTGATGITNLFLLSVSCHLCMIHARVLKVKC